MMSTLQKMLFKAIMKSFIVTLLMLSFVLILVEFFTNLMAYLNFETSLLLIFKIHLFYLPSCFYQAFPLALLFSISFSLGNFYANNELIAVFSSGFPLFRFVKPVVIFSLLCSLFSFFFQEWVVLDSNTTMNRLKDEATRQYSRQQDVQSAIDHQNGIIYYADYFVAKSAKLRRVIVIERNKKNQPLVRIDATSAEWDEHLGQWKLFEARVFSWDEKGEMMEENYFPEFTSEKLSLNPKIFKSVDLDIEGMHIVPAYYYLKTLRETGRRKEYLSGITPFYRRLTYPLVNLIVSMIACTIGSWFKKNILILSLGLSLGLAVVYYVFQMITVLLAKNGYIPAVIGAVLPELVFTLVGINLFKNARS